jgi:hypothetical protein
MATKKQIAANRANAQKSTGPRSVEGKAVSSQNALKSGIDAQSQVIRGEDPAALQALTAQYFGDHQPQSAEERALVDILIDCEWTLRRLRRVEAHLWEQECTQLDERHQRWHHEPHPETEILGRAFLAFQQAMTRLERRRDLVHRTYHRALHDLREIQASRPDPEPPPAPSPTPSIQTPNPEIGFVPEIPAVLPSEPPAGSAGEALWALVAGTPLPALQVPTGESPSARIQTGTATA